MNKNFLFLKNKYNINFLDFNDIEKLVEFIFLNNIKTINFMYFANFSLLNSDKQYLKAMQSCDLVLVDGIGMQIYFKSLLGIWVNNNNGTVLMPLILKYCSQKSYPVAFYGATEKSINGCYEKYKGKGVVYYVKDGYSELDWNQIRDNSILLVGLGSPNQEKWQYKHSEIIKKKNITVFGVGGFFDFCSGKAKRAPQVILLMKLEWLFRLLQNPKQHLKKNIRNLFIIPYAIKAFFS